MKKDTHYLKEELYTLIQHNPKIVDFIEEGSLDGMWYWDLTQPEHEWMSPSFWTTFGYDPDHKQHLASEWQEMIHPDDLATALENFNQHCADPDHPYTQLVRYKHKTGGWVWVRCRGLAIRDEQGQPIRMLGTHINVTDIQNEKLHLDALIRALPGVAFVFDAEGTYLDIMGTRESLLFDLKSELLGKKAGDLIPGEQVKMCLAAIKTALETGETQTLEYWLNTISGKAWFEARVTPMSPTTKQQEPTVLWLAHDITERKLAQERLERSNEDLERFAYVASHDLRAPLRAISQLSEWIEEDMGDKFDPESAEHFSLLKKRVARMDNLIVALLDYSRAARGFSPQEVDIGESARLVIDLLGPNTKGFTFEIAPDLPSITTDPLVIQQTLQNLFGNAIKHHDVGTGTISLRAEDHKNHIYLLISDDGPGIPEKFRERIFTMFQTLKARDTLEAAGIGLSIVRKVLTAAGGHVTVHDNQPRGTTFRVFLPKNNTHHT